jgi:hypothetical protein
MMYASFYGRNSTMAELLDREATRAVRDGLLALRHDVGTVWLVTAV